MSAWTDHWKDSNELKSSRWRFSHLKNTCSRVDDACARTCRSILIFVKQKLGFSHFGRAGTFMFMRTCHDLESKIVINGNFLIYLRFRADLVMGRSCNRKLFKWWFHIYKCNTFNPYLHVWDHEMACNPISWRKNYLFWNN